MSTCIVYLASPLTGYNSILPEGENRIDMMYMSLKNVTTLLELPVIIFHEDLTDQVMGNMKKIHANTTFEQVDMIRPDLSFEQRPCLTSKISDGKCACPKLTSDKNPRRLCFRPKGYLMMCRFFSGYMQRHPSLQEYDSYIRFDDDSFLLPPFVQQQDFLNNMNCYDYVFRSLFWEQQDQSGLIGFTLDFCRDNGLDWPSRIAPLKKSGVLDGEGRYTGVAPYNNFHFSKLSLWRHPLVEKYVDELEAVGGCLQKGWMDANIHAMIAFVLMPLIGRKPFAVTDFGYRHNKHFSQEGDAMRIIYLDEERFFPLIDIREIDNP